MLSTISVFTRASYSLTLPQRISCSCNTAIAYFNLRTLLLILTISCAAGCSGPSQTQSGSTSVWLMSFTAGCKIAGRLLGSRLRRRGDGGGGRNTWAYLLDRLGAATSSPESQAGILTNGFRFSLTFHFCVRACVCLRVSLKRAPGYLRYLWYRCGRMRRLTISVPFWQTLFKRNSLDARLQHAVIHIQEQQSS